MRPGRATGPRPSPKHLARGGRGEDNIGPLFDASVARIRRMMLPAGLDDDYDLAYEHFFDVMREAPCCRRGTPCEANENIDPLGHFLRHGAPAAPACRTSTSTSRSPSSRAIQRRRQPEQSPYLEWLEQMAGGAEVRRPCPGCRRWPRSWEIRPRASWSTCWSRPSDLQDRLRTGTLGEMLARRRRRSRG